MRTQFAFVAASLLLSKGAYSDGDNYKGSRFSEVWGTVSSSDPGNTYTTLPQHEVDYKTLEKRDIEGRAKKTFADRADITPPYVKPVHPNGICFAGTWSIGGDSPYTGYFAKGSKALIVMRASVATGETKQGEYRAFGLGGKLFPTTDENHATPLATANFFVIEDLGGTKTAHFTDAFLSNSPPLSVRAGHLWSIWTLNRIKNAFKKADPKGKQTERQLYEVSELGLANPKDAITPRYFGLRAFAGQTANAKDFRNELLLKNRGDKLAFGIFVTGNDSKEFPAEPIGKIVLTQDALTRACDELLAFHHPIWRDDLRFAP